jgi:hypothetical protein
MFEKEDVSKSIGGQIRDTIHDVAKSLAAVTDGRYKPPPRRFGNKLSALLS